MRHGFTLLACAAKRFHLRWAEAYSNSSTMFRFLKQQRRQQLRAQPFPPAWRSFLAEKHFEGCGSLELTDEIRVTIAAQACLLLLHRVTDYYPQLTSILSIPRVTHRTKRDTSRVISGTKVANHDSVKPRAGSDRWCSLGTMRNAAPRIPRMGGTWSCTSSPISSTTKTFTQTARQFSPREPSTWHGPE